jgi:hypothetical protein
MNKAIDGVACAREGCDREVHYGGCSKGVLESMFGGSKLAATAYTAVQAGWEMRMKPNGGACMFCPDHKEK